MKRFLTMVCAMTLTLSASADDKKGDFVKLFDGKTLTGWKSFPSGTGKWKVEDGCIVGSGPASHLFTERGDFTDLHLKAEVSINEGGNSGMYFRTQFGPGFPKGYEAQINSTHRDPVKTGSLYNFVPVKDILVKPGEFFIYEVIAKGNTIEIKVNGKKSHAKGHIAFQQHHDGSVVKIKSVEVKELSDK